MSFVNDPDYSEYMKLGEKNDATSLENMKKSLAFLKECNELMEREGLEPFVVNNNQMALAQVGVNISSVTIDHSGTAGAENLAWGNELMEREGLEPFVVNNNQMALAQVGVNISSVTIDHSGTAGAENLAWGGYDILKRSPYDDWYGVEKKRYENGERDWHRIGHYMNLIGDNRITGFAFHSPVWDSEGHGINVQTYGQTFGYDGLVDPEHIYTLEEYTERFMAYYNQIQADLNGEQAALDQTYGQTFGYDGLVDPEHIYTLEEYTERFMAYYNQIQADLNGEQAALDALNAAKEGLANAKTGVEAATSNAASAKDALTAATAKKDAQQGVVNGTQTQLTQEMSVLEEKKTAQQNAQTAYDEALAQVETSKKELEEAKQD